MNPISVLAALIAVVGIGLSGCGPAPCSQRKGTFSSKFVERDGICGPIFESVDTISEQPKVPTAPCLGTITYSDDNCRVTVEQTCPVDTSTKAKINGVTTWNTEGSKGTGVYKVDATPVAAGGTRCVSTYDVTVTKL